MDRQEFLTLIDDSRSRRSLQKAVGPSEIGGCRRRLWHRIQQTPACNDTLQMAAWMGTAIHQRLERAVKSVDPFESRYLTEVAVEHEGLTGHVDLYDKESREVIDWKTVTRRKLTDFPAESQVQQVQVYGYLMVANGFAVDAVTLVAIPRDGNELHVKFHTEGYDEAIALDAIARLREVESLAVAPAPEEPRRFCQDYCQFFDETAEVGCPSANGWKDRED